MSSGYKVKYYYNATIKKHKQNHKVNTKPPVKQNKNKR